MSRGPEKLLPEHHGVPDDHSLPAHREAKDAKTNGADGKKTDGDGTDGKTQKGKGWEPSDDQNDELEFELPPPAKMSKGKITIVVVVALIVVALAFILGFLPKWRQNRQITEETSEANLAAPRVELVSPKVMTQDRPLELPGIIEALEDTVVYPRASGYVRRWLVDIGDQVKEGQLLAEIDTPELDAQLEQARADLVQAQANELRAETSGELSTTEQKRYETLTPAGVTSGQELEQRRTQAKVDDANIKVAKATVASQQAAVNRLVHLKAFARPVAPFSGTITARTIERGALVSADSKTPMYRVAALDPVRIFVQVPQDVAPSIRTGTPSQIAIREFPTRKFDGVVSRAAGALDESTRTMTTEIRVPNSKHELMPGMYVKAELSLAVPHRVYEIPSTALYINADGVRIAIIDADNKAQMRKVNIERDTGNAIQISAGLDGSERIVKIANAAITDGTKVEIIPPKAEQKGDQPKDDQKTGDKPGGAQPRSKTDTDEGAEKSLLPGGAPTKPPNLDQQERHPLPPRP